MKSLCSKILIAIVLSFLAFSTTFAQSCDSLKEIFENSDFCDNKWISISGKVYEVLNNQALQGSKYEYSFQFTDDGTNIIRIVSQDKLFLLKDDEVVINGGYHRKLYAEGLNLDDTIVASGKNIKVILTAEDYADLLVNYVGKGILRNETLQKRNIILAALIPLFAIAAFYLGLIFYKRRRIKGISFEGCVENLFKKEEWRLSESNAYRKHRRWIESNSNPDFVFIHRKTDKRIAVECKYRRNEYRIIFWAYEDQIESYQNFSAKEKAPVFIVIGIGGRERNPKRMFLVPLALLKYPDARLEYLKKFERDPKRYFSLDKNGYLI